MNGQVKMYRSKPIIRHDLPVDLPKCMYSMKNIHRGEKRNGTTTTVVEEWSSTSDHISTATNRKVDILEQVKLFLKNTGNNNPEMAAVVAKQEQILEQLALLKKQLNNIRTQLRLDQKDPVTTTISTPQLNITNQVNRNNFSHSDIIVVNASPTNPPYSLLLIQKLLENHVHLQVQSHRHSTVSIILNDNNNSIITELTAQLEQFVPKTLEVPLELRLIWKEVAGADLELLVSHTPILGEVNLVRYLARLTNTNLNYENQPNPHEIDTILDLSYRLVHCQTKSERAQILQTFNKSLVSQQQWLAGRSQITIADLAAYSAIKQIVSVASEIKGNLKKWFDRCDALV